MVAADRRMTPEQIEQLATHLLRLPALFSAAAAQLRTDMFSPGGEDRYAILWAAAVAQHNTAGACSMQVLHAELAAQSTSYPDLVDDYQLLLGPHGLIARIASCPADQLSEATGRQLLQRFLIERAVVNDIQHQFLASYEAGSYPRQLPALLRRAVEQIDQIESITSAQPRLRIVSDAEFSAGNYAIEWHVRGLLAKGQPCIVGGPSKSLKTSLMLDLAISLANVFPCDFGNCPLFACAAASVLFISAEMGKASLQDVRRRIVPTKGLHANPVRMHWCFEAPKLSDDGDMRFLRRQIEALRIEIVFFDPLYLMLLTGSSGVSASNLYEMGPLLRKISQVCLDAGATPVYLHHFNRQGAVGSAHPTLEDLSFAGVAEFARQWILLKRREPYIGGTGQHELWLAAGGSAGHSGIWAVDVAEGV
ncbi:MAG TPA: AAA family ATPase, partial [Chloroflexota bacterium]|nr:AAA family ATPase [Chloroflexota bacterium]